MNEPVPHIETTTRSSPMMHNLVNTLLDHQGATTNTQHGRAMLHLILNNSPQLPQHEIADDHVIMKTETDDPVAHEENRRENHPLVQDIALERLVHHGNTLKDYTELHNHLQRLSYSLRDFRKGVASINTKEPTQYDSEKNDEHKVIVNVIPKKLQQHLANQFKTLISHPDLHNPENNATHLHPLSDKLLRVIHRDSRPAFMSRNLSYDHIDNFDTIGEFLISKNGINNHEVRNDFLNFLDHHEQQSKDKILSGNLRTLMMIHPQISGKERIRHITSLGQKSSDYFPLNKNLLLDRLSPRQENESHMTHGEMLDVSAHVRLHHLADDQRNHRQIQALMTMDMRKNPNVSWTNKSGSITSAIEHRMNIIKMGKIV